MDTITFDDFKKIDIRIGKIISAEKVEGSDKLLKLEVDFGFEEVEMKTMELAEKKGGEAIKKEFIPAKRQIVAGIAQFYAPEALIGKECPFVYNLAPRILKGLESQGMILCASAPLSTDPSDNSNPVLLHPDKEIQPGSVVK